MSQHNNFIRECIRLAEQAKANGNHPFGSVLVHDGEIILRAQNGVNTYNDLGHHPESIIARTAASKYDPEFLADCTLYTSTEPCAMCTGAIYWSGIGRVVFACSVQKLAEFTSDSLSITCAEILSHGDHAVEVIGHILEEEAAQVHVDFWDT
ncbi:MAG: nucleoside deaminase [Chloroflexota bacterium]